MTIAESVEKLRHALAWTNEATALGDPVGDWNGDDTVGALTMGPVRVEWLRDVYGDGEDEWITIEVTVAGESFDTDGYSDLRDAVTDAAHMTLEWQHFRDADIRAEVVSWLEHRGEFFDILGPQNVHDSWTITWGEVMVQGYYAVAGVFLWSVVNPESGDCRDGDANDDADAVIDAMIECAKDPMVEAWVESVAMLTAEDDWSVRSSADQMYVYQHSASAYGTSRRAYYESVGYEEGQIELEYRVRGSEWRPFDEYLPEDEDDVRADTRKAYAWVKAVDS